MNSGTSSWLVQCFLQSAVLAVSFWLALVFARCGSSLAWIFGIFGILFFFYIFKNPEFWYRRLSFTLISFSIALLTVPGAVKLVLESHRTPEAWKVSFLAELSQEGMLVPAIAFLLAGIVVALFDGYWRANRSFSTTEFAASGEILEASRKDAGHFHFRSELSVVNRSKESVSITGARLTFYPLLLPITRVANSAMVRRGAMLEPSRAGGVVTIGPGEHTLVVDCYAFDRVRSVIHSRFPRAVGFYDRLFGRALLTIEARQSWARAKIDLHVRSSTRLD